MQRAAVERMKSSGELPSPTGVALQILKLAQKDDASIAAIADAVQADPAISSRLLKMVNSPLAGLSRQVGSVSKAVSMLGIKTVTHLALGFSLVSNHRKGACASFDYDLFWSESLAGAVAARRITKCLKCFAPDEAFTCGLVSQIGRLALATAFPYAYSDALRVTPADNREELAKLEESLFEIDHCTLAAEMMADWHMPEIFQQAVQAQLDPDSADLDPDSRSLALARCLHLSGCIAMILPKSMTSRDALSALVVKADRLGIAPDVYHEVFDSISHGWQEMGTVFSVPTRRVPAFAEMYTQAAHSRSALELREASHDPAAAIGDQHHVQR